MRFTALLRFCAVQSSLLHENALILVALDWRIIDLASLSFAEVYRRTANAEAMFGQSASQLFALNGRAVRRGPRNRSFALHN